MRRKDREITDPRKVEAIIQACDCCRLGLINGKSAYIVPLNFGYHEGTFYFHGALEGLKLDLIRENGYASFELDTGHELRPAQEANRCSFRYQSVMGTGSVMLVEDLMEKRRGLLCIMEHYTGRDDWEIDEKMMKSTAVMKLTVDSMSCKEHE